MSLSRAEATLQASNFFIQGQTEEAIKLYSELLATSLDYNLFINRCVAYISQNDFDNSFKDATAAIQMDSKRYEGYLYRGITNFNSGKIDESSTDFNEALNNGVPQVCIDKWVKRCTLELSHKKIKSIEEINQEESKKNEPKEDLPKKYHIYSNTGKLAYTWFQTDKIVGVALDYRVSDRKKLKYKLEEDTIEVSFPIDGSKDYNLHINLWGTINPQASKVLPGLQSLELTLEKKIPNLNWEHLSKDDVEENLLVNEDKVPLYPTSAHQKKDWNKIDKELEEEIRIDQEKYGDARKGLIEALYNNSNEEQRMALAKSVQGSKGCYITTNWDEVKDTDFKNFDFNSDKPPGFMPKPEGQPDKDGNYFDRLNQPKPFLTESTPTSKLKSKGSTKQPFYQIFKKGSFHLETQINPVDTISSNCSTRNSEKPHYKKHRKTEPFKNQNMVTSAHNPLINFNNTISGGWNQANKPKMPSLPQKLHRQSSQITSTANMAQTGSRFFSELNIPKIPTRVFPNPAINSEKNNSDPTYKASEMNNNSQTFSQPNNRSNFDKTKHISTNYTTSTEALYEPEINGKNYKNKEDFILNSFQKNSLPVTKEESPVDNIDINTNHKKKKLDEAKKQAEFFDDNKIKQYKFAKADEDEEMNFRELCNAFQSLN